MLEIKNEQLGNFGFLLDFNEDFLFEFAQLAESNLYVNKRLCAVYIRQLIESFLDTVIYREGIQLKDDQKSLNDGAAPMASIKDKQRAINNHFYSSPYRQPSYIKRVFPKYPGSDSIPYSRLICPEGEGDNRIKGQLVDSDKKTLYVWDFIRRLGNAGSHAVLTKDNKRWLDEKYIKAALEQLCVRMGSYFYGVNNQTYKKTYHLERYSLASREVFYPQAGAETITVRPQGILPGYVEKKYFTVMPRSYLKSGKVLWENYINKYYIIRRYEIAETDNVRDYLLQSQKAYLILQQTGSLEGIAPYAVLADLRNSADYYVTSYGFDLEPRNLCAGVLKEFGITDHAGKFLVLQKTFIKIMMTLSENHIYHRNLTHDSVKLCRREDGGFTLKVIDFELVKLFEQEEDIPQATVCQFFNEQTLLLDNPSEVPGRYDPYGNIRQYGSAKWNEDTPETEYQREQRRRTGMILLNMLCPVHFDNARSFETVASLEEICRPDNIIYKNIEEKLIMRLYHMWNKLRMDQGISIAQAYEMIEEMENEYRFDLL